VTDNAKQLPGDAGKMPAPRPDPNKGLLQLAVERLKARGDSSKRFACMQLPTPVFNELCERLIERSKTVKETADWLAGETPDAPTKSSVERFSDALFEEYRLAQLSERRGFSERYVQEITQGDPDAQAMALNSRVTELLTDAFMQADDANAIDPKRLMALLAGARMVAQTAFDKQKMDVRIKALEGQIASREKDIALKDAKLKAIPERVNAVEKRLRVVLESHKKGEKIQPQIYEAIFDELTAIRKEAA
jgi:uncharacterized protein DUF3486